MSNSFLSQEEIDALLKGNVSTTDEPSQDTSVDVPATEEMQNLANDLNNMEKDALGEIGNISMGTAATTLSQLLNQRVKITTPRVNVTDKQKFISSFNVPYVFVEVDYTEGLQGSSVLIIKIEDALIIADLMLGGDGKNPNGSLSEIALSAVSEAMNQMIGSAATSMSQIFSKPVIISPPKVKTISLIEEVLEPPFNEEFLCVTSFNMEIGELIKSEIMQVMPIIVAKEEVELLLNPKGVTRPNEVNSDATTSAGNAHENPAPVLDNSLTEEHTVSIKAKDIKNIDLILDVPLEVSVLLGKTKKPLKEVLALYPGSIVELEKLADEPVDILINGTLIAKGEVVVINENFGVRIINIISPIERINYLQ